MSFSKKYLIVGPPGTGKTTTAIRILEHLVGQEHHEAVLFKLGIEIPWGQYELRDIAFVSFQTSVIREFAERTGLKLSYREESETEFFTTFHGLAYRLARDNKLLKNNNKNRSPEELFKYFLDTHGLRGQFDTSALGFSEVGRKGNRIWLAMTKAVGEYYHILGLNAYHKAKMMLEPELRKYIPLWIRWKEEENPWGVKLIDYNDMLITAYDGLKEGKIKPPFRILIVDEAQDNNPLMWAIQELLTPHLDYIIALGDPDQAVFGFAGAKPELLETWDDRDPEVKRIVLPQSYRVPKKPLWVGLSVIRKTKSRKEKEFKPRDEEGSVYRGYLYPKNPEDVRKFLRAIQTEAYRIAQEVTEPEKKVGILLLARTNTLAMKLARILLRHQVRFEHLKSEAHSIWEAGDKKIGTLGDLVEVLRKVKARERLTTTDWIVLTHYSKIEVDIDQVIRTLESGQFPLNLLELKRRPFAFLDKVSIIQAIYPDHERREVARWVNNPPRIVREFFELIEDIVTGRDKPLELPKRVRIAIDTFHASKGREGYVNMIWNNLPSRRWAIQYLRTRDDYDSELRVWYVAVTRTIERLYIWEGPYPFITL